MDTKDPSILQLVAFAILMESDSGIVWKSPGYIAEKWRWCSGCVDPLELKASMDQQNQNKFDNWKTKWKQ